MTRRWISVAIVSVNVGLSLYYLGQGRPGESALLAGVAIVLTWLAFRPASTSTTVRPVRSLTGGAIAFGVVALMLLIALGGADGAGQVALTGVGALVSSGLTVAMLWALARARRMGYGWSSEVERRRRPTRD